MLQTFDISRFRKGRKLLSVVCVVKEFLAVLSGRSFARLAKTLRVPCQTAEPALRTRSLIARKLFRVEQQSQTVVKCNSFRFGWRRVRMSHKNNHKLHI